MAGTPASADSGMADRRKTQPSRRRLLTRFAALVVTGLALYVVLPSLSAVFGAWPKLATLSGVWLFLALRHLEQETRTRQDAVAGRVAAISTNLSDLSSQFSHEKVESALADVRGISPVAFGFVMTAVPYQLECVSLFGALFTGAALVVTAGVGSLVFPNMLRASAP
jgi:hypothetical protein